MNAELIFKLKQAQIAQIYVYFSFDKTSLSINFKIFQQRTYDVIEEQHIS